MVIVIYVKKVKRGRESDDCKKNDDSSISKKSNVILCDDDYIVSIYGVAQIIGMAGINFEIGKRMEI